MPGDFGSGTGRSGLAGDDSLRSRAWLAADQQPDSRSPGGPASASSSRSPATTVSRFRCGNSAMQRLELRHRAEPPQLTTPPFYGASNGHWRWDARTFNAHLDWVDGNIYWDAGNGGRRVRINAIAKLHDSI